MQRWPIEILPNHPSQWFIRNYKSDSWVTDDLWGDEWVYVIKSGLCVVAKAIDELEMHRSGLKRFLVASMSSAVEFIFQSITTKKKRASDRRFKNEKRKKARIRK